MQSLVKVHGVSCSLDPQYFIDISFVPVWFLSYDLCTVPLDVVVGVVCVDAYAIVVHMVHVHCSLVFFELNFSSPACFTSVVVATAAVDHVHYTFNLVCSSHLVGS